MKTTTIAYPWFTTLLALLAVLYFFFQPDIAALGSDSIAIFLGTPEKKLLIALFALALIAWDIARLWSKEKTIVQQNTQLQERLQELITTKNALQQKVQKYSGHADKLKLFISDRLLEYIEYDEKFLHFKNIAAEVRHNGIVSYDRVSSALQKAMATCPAADREAYESALENMRYLWDLLDLSTTDNMAMYVANRVYESEEQYYQHLLNQDDKSPFTPLFSARNAVMRAVKAHIQDIGKPLPMPQNNEDYFYENDQVILDLKDAGNLLGNENHLVLLAENIINNALFYTNKEDTQKDDAHAKIGITTYSDADNSIIRIYNHGPHIDEKARKNLFKLGYSSKGEQGHHGKGLGLYFVHEITQGFEGKIRVTNIVNAQDEFEIQATLEDGRSVSETVRVHADRHGKPLCAGPSNNTMEEETLIPCTGTVTQLRITAKSSGRICEYIGPTAGEGGTYSDCASPTMPQWQLSLRRDPQGDELIFRPLDIRGVEFEVSIPTANSRLAPEFHQQEEKFSGMETLERNFKDIKQPLS